MVRVVFITAGGARHEAMAEPGLSLMEAAIAARIPGIDADCFGACACATCAVALDDGWAAALSAPGTEERAMLADIPGSGPRTRLSCQIIAAAALDGITLHVPEAQHR